MPNRLLTPQLAAKPQPAWQGAGLGLHAGFLPELLHTPARCYRVYGNSTGKLVNQRWPERAAVADNLAERIPLVAHGLNLNLGGQRPLDKELILAIKGLRHRLNLRFYSEHLSWCADAGNFTICCPCPLPQRPCGM